MEVEGSSSAPANNGQRMGETPPPRSPLQTAYTPSDRSAAANPSMYCILCGTRVAAADEKCSNCGCPIQVPRDDDYRPRRRSRPRPMYPVRGLFAVIGAILIPIGIVFFIGAPIADEFLRRNPLRTLMPILLVLLGVVVELCALACCVLWLHQAWQAVSREDDDYSPGLMVWLLFVPFFNCYWMFRAVPGLSKAIHRELRLLAPSRASSAGWVPGVVACVFALIPYGQPIAVCIFVAWMLIANHSLQRLIRLHEQWLDSGVEELGDARR